MKRLLLITDEFQKNKRTTGQLMIDLALHLKESYEVTVITTDLTTPRDQGESQGDTYKLQKFEGIKVVRVKAIKSILSAAVRMKSHDLIFVHANDSMLYGLMGRWIRRLKGGKLVYNIQTLAPEWQAAQDTKLFNPKTSLCKWVDSRSIRKADKVILPGRDMYKTATNRRKVNRDKATVVSNWVNEEKIHVCKGQCRYGCIGDFVKLYKTNERFTFMYSGDITLNHDLENIIKVMGSFKDVPDMQFIFAGAGPLLENLKTYTKNHNITNIGFYQPIENQVLQCALNSADVHIISNYKGIKGVSVPLSIYEILGVGKPAMAIVESGSETQMVIDETGCGKWVQPMDYVEMTEQIQWFYDNQKEAREMGLAGRAFLDENLSQANALKKVAATLRQVVESE